MKWKFLLGTIFAAIFLISLGLYFYLEEHKDISALCSDKVYDSAGQYYHYENENKFCHFFYWYIAPLFGVIAILPFMVLTLLVLSTIGISEGIAVTIGAVLNLITYFVIGLAIGSAVDTRKAKQPRVSR